MLDTKHLTIKEARRLLDAGEISPAELFAAYQSRIKEHNTELNAFLATYQTQTPAISGSVLRDIPVAIKDNILIQGEITTAGSKMLANYKAAFDATAISRLRLAGATFLGKTNMDEFAMGASGENSAFGPTRNPHDTERVAGGSSSGSAAAVAAGLAPYALGSDTGGSIRGPASYCGVVGLKPTYGRVSRHGLIAMASSLDQIGPITRTIEDAALVLNEITGFDRFDATSSPRPMEDYTALLGQSIDGLKVAVLKQYFMKGLNPDVEHCIRRALEKLQSAGAEITEVDLPMTEYALATYYIIVPSEVSSNLARFDGIRYGLSVQRPDGDLLDVYRDTRAEGFGPEVRRRIMLGTYALSAGYYDAYYLKALKVRTLIRREFEELFKHYDVVIGPTTPDVAPKIGEVQDPLAMYLADVFTAQANLAGIPALSMPCGTISREGKELPVGLQIMGDYFAEAKILQVGHALESLLTS